MTTARQAVATVERNYEATRRALVKIFHQIVFCKKNSQSRRLFGSVFGLPLVATRTYTPSGPFPS